MYHEQKEPLVSVIIPVYNVEDYLERCVESVIKQRYSNLEILLVDDGSTDNSGKLCDKLAENDNRIRVIHKANGGLSDARNVALNVMQGEWVTFVDSDDWVSKEYVDCMLSMALKNKAQIAVALYTNVTGMDDIKINQREEKTKTFNNKEGIKALLYQKYFTTSAPCKMYNATLWDKIRFPKGRLYEDVNTIYNIFKSAEKTIFKNEIIYFYFQRQDSIVRKSFSIQKMDYVKNSREILEDIKKIYPELKNGAISRLVWAQIHVLVQMDNFKIYSEEYDELWSDIKRFRLRLLFNSQVRMQNKLVLILSFAGTKMLKKIYNMTR